MKIRSPRLGDAELTGRLESLKTQGDHIIVALRISEPASWQVRTALTNKDLTRLLCWFIRNSGLIFLLTGCRRLKNPRPPVEFEMWPDFKNQS